MNTDVINRDGVAVRVHDAVAEISCPEFIGRLTELLVSKKIITAGELQSLLPFGYEVREG